MLKQIESNSFKPNLILVHYQLYKINKATIHQFRVIIFNITHGQRQEPLIQKSKPQKPPERHQETQKTKVRISQGSQPTFPQKQKKSRPQRPQHQAQQSPRKEGSRLQSQKQRVIHQLI